LARAGFAPRGGETHLGDDAAVLTAPPAGSDLVFCTDAGVAGVHADLTVLSAQDLGWRATVATLSDVAAMGAAPWCLVVSTSAPEEVSIDELMEGVIEAAARFGCPVVGGDVSSSATAVVAVAALGVVPQGTALLRSGASPGDLLYVTGPLGGSAAGLRHLRATGSLDDEATGLALRHRRPTPRFDAGILAREAGASAAIDVSDGLGRDLHRLADASAVGFALREVPVTPGASEEEALGGGEDFELVLAAPKSAALPRAFAQAGIDGLSEIGVVVDDTTSRTLQGQPLGPLGYQHETS
jgi:thiamine-monophosphate kinase